MIIDELITLIRFDMPKSSSSALDGANSRVENLTKSVSGFGKDADAAFKSSEKGVSRFTRTIRDMGLASLAAGSLTAALGVNAANNANTLMYAADAANITTDRLQQLESVYRSVGGSASNAARDAQAFFRMTNTAMDDNALDVISSHIEGMNEAQKNDFLQSMGFSQDFRRVVNIGEEEFQSRMAKAEKFHSITRNEIDDLVELDSAMGNFNSRLSAISESLQGKLAPGFTSFFTAMEEGLNRNEDLFQSWGNSIGSTLTNLFDGFRGNIGRLNEILEGERTDEAIAVMQSDDENIRRENLERLRSDATQRSIGNYAGFVIGAGKAIWTDSTIAGEYENLKNLEKTSWAAVETAEHFDNIATRGHDYASIDSLSVSISERMRELFSSYGMRPIEEEAQDFQSTARDFANEIVKSGSLDEWLSSSKDYREMAIMDVFSRGRMSPEWANATSNGGANVTNNITINGVRGAEQAVPAVGQAAATGTQNALQNGAKTVNANGFSMIR